MAGDQVTGSPAIAAGRVLAVIGWAADPQDGAPVKQMQVLIDGAVVGNAGLNQARPDVASAYGKPAYTNSGWSFVYAAGYMSGGTHTVSAIATDSLGLSTTLGTKTITVANQPPFGSLDMVGDQLNGSSTIPQADVVAIVGWAADTQQGAPVSQVQVLIDGAVVGNATLGLSRPDVSTAYNNSAYANSGYSFVYAGGYLTKGSHTASVIASDSLGLSTTLGTKSFTIQ
jgi:surface antigen